MQRNKMKDFIFREKLIYRYVTALDQGDIGEVAAVLEAALDDSELNQAIVEINMAYHEEEGLSQFAADANLVRELLRKHFLSAFEEDTDEGPLTVGEVAARLQADRRISKIDQETNHLLLRSTIPVPTWLSISNVKKLAAELGVSASERFWDTFRDVAISLSMGRSHKQARLAAAREQRTSYLVRQGRKSSQKDKKNGEDE
jgi:DNA-binding phage protein